MGREVILTSSKLASFVSLFLMHKLLIFERTVSIISIVSMGEILNGIKTLAGLCLVSVFSIIYLSCLKLIFKFGMFSKTIFAGSSASSSLIIICSTEFERFGFLNEGCGVLVIFFNLVASELVFIRIFTISVDDGIKLFRVFVVEVLSWQLILEVDNAGFFLEQLIPL